MTPTTPTRSRRRGRRRLLAAIVPTLASAMLLTTTAPAHAVFDDFSKGTRVTTPGPDVQLSTRIFQYDEAGVRDACYLYADSDWEVNGAPSAAVETKLENQMAAAVKKSDVKAFDDPVFVSADGNTGYASAAVNPAAGTSRCPDVLQNDYHSRRLSDIGSVGRYLAAFAAGVVVDLAVTTGLIAAAYAFFPEFAVTPKAVDFAACIGGAAGTAVGLAIVGTREKVKFAASAIACLGNVIPARIVKRLVTFLSNRVPGALATVTAGGAELVSSVHVVETAEGLEAIATNY